MSDITMDKHMKRIEVDYHPAKEKLRLCYIWLDFTKEEAQQYINGETYGLTLTAFSASDFITDTVLIKTYVAPYVGMVEVC